MIEIPAGLVDPGEGAAESAVRELREETGYHGVVTELSPVMFNGELSHFLTLFHDHRRQRGISRQL